MPAPAAPSITSPTPIGRQSFNNYVPDAADTTASVAIPQPKAMPSALSASDVTATIPVVQATPGSGRLALIPIRRPKESRCDRRTGASHRALKGDPTAAYELGVRFAEGKGVAPNFDEARNGYDRAAQAGVVPAIFRLGTLYEKA